MRVKSIFLLSLAFATVGCRQDMHDQPKFEPLEATDIFANGSSSRPLVPGTVPRGHLQDDRAFYAGLDADGAFLTYSPVPVDRALIERGQGRFNTFCSPCHGRRGLGDGMIVRRGFKQPTSFHDPRLRATPLGQFFNVMTNGFGQMSSYAAQIKPRDRWAIAVFIRALQQSRNTSKDLLSPEELLTLREQAFQPHAETH